MPSNKILDMPRVELPLTPERQADIRRMFAQALQGVAINDPVLREHFIGGCLDMLSRLPGDTGSLPETFFDVARAGRIHARREALAPKEALQKLFENPHAFFDIHNLKPLKKSRRYANKRVFKDATQWPHKSTLTLDDIEASGRATVAATGRRPTQYDTDIAYGPLTGNTTWRSLHVAFVHGYRGLKDCGFKTLAEFFNYRQVGTPDFMITLAQIEDSARATLAATGRRPLASDAMVAHGPLKDLVRWKNINAAFMRGNLGLRNCGYNSLSQFLDARNIARIKTVSLQP